MRQTRYRAQFSGDGEGVSAPGHKSSGAGELFQFNGVSPQALGK
ncbi:MAG: hypothetical protein V7K60_09960 [Nostoc sp.]